MRSILKFSSLQTPIVFLMRFDSSTKFLGMFGAILTCSYLLNAVTAFDDIHFATIFPALVAQHGYFKTCWVLLSGMDMPNEYRTYALSRLLHFLIWSIGGGQSFFFPLTIAVSQVGSAIAILYLARERGIDERVSLAVATIWLISPFSANWCFHHYSYEILPFQIIIVSCLVLGRITTAPRHYIIASLLGMACALSGEMSLITAPLSLLLLALASSDKSRRSLTFVTISSMIFTLIIHRWVWGEYFQDVTAHQRFQINMEGGLESIAFRTVTALKSIFHSIWLQLLEIWLSGFGWGSLAGGLTGIFYWWLWKSGKSSIVQTNASVTRGRYVSNVNLALFFIGLAFSSLLIVLTTSVISGQVYEIMPRRYGYVPFTLLLLAFVMIVAQLSQIVCGTKRLVLAISIGLVAAFAGQFHFGAVPAVRDADASLISLMKKAGGLTKNQTKTAKGILFFVSANHQYQLAYADGATPGPKMDGQIRAELLESPFSRYWTSEAYSTNFLGFSFVGIPKSSIDAETIELGGEGGYPHPIDRVKIHLEDVVVVANLGFESQDPLGRYIRIFDNFTAFQPYFFGRQIIRDVKVPSTNFRDEFVIDLGHVAEKFPQNISNIMPDKKFAESIGVINNSWISDYGLLSGENSVNTHPNVSNALIYYRTNRNGMFTYGVAFNNVGMIEVSLDFWEQWGRQSGDRVFELEVSWDGISWASLGNIDIAGLNQDNPVSIVLTRRDPSVFQFRMKQAVGSKDIPVIQGLRIRKLTSL